MNKKFTASPLAKENHVFQASITFTDDGLILKIPDFWKNKEFSCKYEDITGFKIDKPSLYLPLSYCTIHLNAHGTFVKAHGFTRDDAKRIKRYIEDGQSSNPPSQNRENSSSRNHEKETYEEWMKRSRKNTNDWLESIGKFAEEQRSETLDLIEKIKRTLTSTAKLVYLHRHLKEINNEKRYQVKYKAIQRTLMNQLKKIGEESKFESILHECRKSAQESVSDDLERIEEENKKERADYFENLRESICTPNDIDEETQYFKGIGEDNKGMSEDIQFPFPTIDSEKKEFNNQIIKLTSAYDSLDIEILENDDEVDKNKKIAGIFIRDCLTKAGRDRIRKGIEQIKDEEEDNDYTHRLEELLTLIDNIYSSLVYKELDSDNKPRFSFGLDKKTVKDKLADHSVSNCDKISKIIDCVDNFINRIDNALEDPDQ